MAAGPVMEAGRLDLAVLMLEVLQWKAVQGACVYVSVCVIVFAGVRTFVRVFVNICVCTFLFACGRLYAFVCEQLFACVCLFVCKQLCAYVCVCVCVRCWNSITTYFTASIRTFAVSFGRKCCPGYLQAA